jgi:pimeloyl-ACP methyl ester carboxylesterase
MTATTVDTRLGPLHVSRHGESGPPLVLWHSLFLDGRSWDPVLPALTPGRTVLVVDGPCHGRSPGPGREFTLAECGDAAIEVMNRFDARIVDWIGNAWGGHVGVELAMRDPERIRSVAALSSPMNALRPLERLTLTVLSAAFRIIGWRRWLVRAVVDALVLPTSPPEVSGYVAEAAQLPGAERTLTAIRSIALGRPSLVEGLSRLNVPTLISTTPDAAIYPPALARAHAASLPRGRFELISGARHIPPIETPAATAKLLLDWLASP